MIRRPPRSPLFPYPPLFRSKALQEIPAGERRTYTEVAKAIGRPKAVRDRKSTRLNSSHSQISYAVFCLKKKKTTCARQDSRTHHADSHHRAYASVPLMSTTH